MISIWQHANSRLHPQMANRVKKLVIDAHSEPSRRTSSRVCLLDVNYTFYGGRQEGGEVQGMQSLATSRGSRWLMNLWWIRSAPFDQVFPGLRVYRISCNFLPKRLSWKIARSNRQFSCFCAKHRRGYPRVTHAWSHRQTRLTTPQND